MPTVTRGGGHRTFQALGLADGSLWHETGPWVSSLTHYPRSTMGYGAEVVVGGPAGADGAA